jgi:C_GCAxxG_C_C family probable redox protein
MKRDPQLDANVLKFGKQYGNCAQTTFLSLQARYKLDCDMPTVLRALTAMPGMGGMGEPCGAVSGSLLALGLGMGPVDPADKVQNARCHAAAHRFCEASALAFGSTDCGETIEHCCGRRYDLTDPEEARRYVAAGGLQQCVNVAQTAVNIAGQILEVAGGCDFWASPPSKYSEMI